MEDVENLSYIKNKIQDIVIDLTEQEKEQVINLLVENKKVKAIGH